MLCFPDLHSNYGSQILIRNESGPIAKCVTNHIWDTELGKQPAMTVVQNVDVKDTSLSFSKGEKKVCFYVNLWNW